MSLEAVEAVIALSIVFVAAEIIRARHGQIGLAAKYAVDRGVHVRAASWLRLRWGAERGRPPEGHIPVALLFFNLGVEAGQLVFVAVVLSIIGIAGRLRAAWPGWTTMAPPYAIGSVASFWMIERVAAF